MWDLALNIFVRPLFLIILFGTAAIIAWLLSHVIPAGRVKDFIYRKRQLVDWWVFLMCVIWLAVVGGIMWWCYRDF